MNSLVSLFDSNGWVHWTPIKKKSCKRNFIRSSSKQVCCPRSLILVIPGVRPSPVFVTYSVIGSMVPFVANDTKFGRMATPNVRGSKQIKSGCETNKVSGLVIISTNGHFHQLKMNGCLKYFRLQWIEYCLKIQHDICSQQY